MKQNFNTGTLTTARIILLSWIIPVAAIVVFVSASLFTSFIRPGINYEFDSSTEGIEDCFGVNDIVSNGIDADTSMKHPPSVHGSASKKYRIGCSWSLYEDGKPAGKLFMNAVITYRVLDNPDEERVANERRNGSTIIAENLSGFDFGFCYIEAENNPTHACESRDSNFRLSFSTNNQSTDLPKITEAAGLVLQETFHR